MPTNSASSAMTNTLPGDGEYIKYTARHIGRREHDGHHARVNQYEPAHTQKAHGVGGKAQHGVEHLKKTIEKDIAHRALGLSPAHSALSGSAKYIRKNGTAMHRIRYGTLPTKGSSMPSIGSRSAMRLT